MGKRKASSPPPPHERVSPMGNSKDMVNGKSSEYLYPDSALVPKLVCGAIPETPKRGLGISPAKLDFSSSSAIVTQTKGKRTPNHNTEVKEAEAGESYIKIKKLDDGLRDLNKEFLLVCEAAVKKDESACLAPILKNYLEETRKNLEGTLEGDFSQLDNEESSYSFKSLGIYFHHLEKNVALKKIKAANNKDKPALKRGRKPRPRVEDFLRVSNHAHQPSGSNNNDSGKDAPKQNDLSKNTQPFANFMFNPARPLGQFTFGKPSATATSESIAAETLVSFAIGKAPKPSNHVAVNNGEEIGKDGLPSFSFPAASKNGFVSQLNSFSELSKPDVELKTISRHSNAVDIGTKSTFSSGFSFNPPPSQPISESTVGEKEKEKEEEEEEQEKYEVKQVVEPDSLYSVRCKVFGIVKKQYKDKGVGQLYIKKLDNGKHSVIVRADNNLGSIVLNILLKEGLPLQKKSAKDVMTVDPVGDDGKPMTVLLRVKSEDEASKLLERLQNFSVHSS